MVKELKNLGWVGPETSRCEPNLKIIFLHFLIKKSRNNVALTIICIEILIFSFLPANWYMLVSPINEIDSRFSFLSLASLRSQ